MMSKELLIPVIFLSSMIGFFVLAAFFSWKQNKESKAAWQKAIKTRFSVSEKSTRFSSETFYFLREQQDVGAYLAQGAQGMHTGLFIRFPDTRPCPIENSVRFFRKGRMKLEDLATRKKSNLPQNQGEFGKRFDIHFDDSDKGTLFRWLDSRTQKVIRELADFQGQHDESVIEIIPKEGLILTWIPGWEATQAKRDPALEKLTRLLTYFFGEQNEKSRKNAEAIFEV